MSAFSHHTTHSQESVEGPLHYLLHQPEGLVGKRPLLLYLHGAGERGDDLRQVTQVALPRLLEAGRRVPFTVLAPQCPAHLVWSHLTCRLERLLDELDPAWQIDPARIYLTGISMGGYGAWKLAARIATRIAALVPVCGAGEADWADALARLPTWAFHGARDSVVPVDASRRMVRALEQVGAPVRLTVFEELDHDCWDRVYESAELYDWLAVQPNVR